MEILEKIKVQKDFNEAPGARDRTDGDFSGQQFLEDLLEPKFLSAVEQGGLLQIDLDHTWGYPSSFVSGSFGQLSKKHTAEKVKKHIKLESDSNILKENILKVINNPDAQK